MLVSYTRYVNLDAQDAPSQEYNEAQVVDLYARTWLPIPDVLVGDMNTRGGILPRGSSVVGRPAQDEGNSSLATFRTGEGGVESKEETTARVTSCIRVKSRTQHVSETYHIHIYMCVRECVCVRIRFHCFSRHRGYGV